jgi:hypothetical protein
MSAGNSLASSIKIRWIAGHYLNGGSTALQFLGNLQSEHLSTGPVLREELMRCK